MTKLSVNPIGSDKSGESLYISKQINAGGPSITSPIMAYNNNLLRNTDNVAPASRGLNEIYLEIPTKDTSLAQFASDSKASDILDSRISSQVNKTNVNELNMCMLECNVKSYPADEEWRFVLDTAHANSDIVPLPNTPFITQSINSDSKFEEYLLFLKKSIEHLRIINEKPIMGVIPKVSYTNINRLVNFYIDHGLNAFYVDLAARNPITAKRDCLIFFKILKNREMIEQSFIYAYNVNSGRLAKAVDAVPAKDILSFGFGFDAMGRKHKRPKLDTSQWKAINTLPNRIRLFNKRDYGYYKILTPERIANFDLTDSCYSFDQIKHALTLSISELRRREGLFNTEQLGIEAFRLKQVIKNDKPIDYLSRKAYVREEDIKVIKKHKNNVTQKQA